MRQLVIKEAYDWITFGEAEKNSLNQREWSDLVQYLQQEYNHEPVVEYGHKRVRFINLVGVIQLQSVRIEILPKITLDDRDDATNRRALLNMLAVTKNLPVSIGPKTMSNFEQVDLLHILAGIYVQELSKTLHRGIYREYRQKSENSATLRGRLLIAEQIRYNLKRNVQAFCEYDELTPDILINQVLKAALSVIYPYIKHTSLKMKLMSILELLDDVESVPIRKEWLDQISLNRQNSHYETALSLARAILHSNTMSSSAHNRVGFCFLFKMNDLFEAYIGEVFRRMLRTRSYVVKTQHAVKKLLINLKSGREDITLKPDFVIENEESTPVVILDTKWKSAFVNGRRNYKQADIYQMYAYVTTYRTAERCIIIYPKIGDEGTMPKWQVPGSFPLKSIEVQTVRLGSIEETVADLEKMMEW